MTPILLAAVLVAPHPTDPPALAVGGATAAPQPPFWAATSPLRAALAESLTAGLGDDDFGTREAAERAMRACGYDGYRAARAAAVTSPHPEVRHRAARVAVAYRGVVAAGRDHHPPVFCLVGRPLGGDGRPVYDPPAGAAEDYLTPAAPLGLLCHHYAARAVRREWEADRLDCPARAGERPRFLAVRAETEVAATGILVRDLIDGGADREWVRWLLAEMGRRHNPWPAHPLVTPPDWLLWCHGFGAGPPPGACR